MAPRRPKEAISDAWARPQIGNAARAKHLRIVEPFLPAGEGGRRSEADPTTEQLRAVLAALAEVTATSLAYLRLTTDIPGPLLGRCVEALALAGLLTAEDRSDGHDGRRTVALTAAGRRALEASEEPADPDGSRRDAGVRSAETPGGAA